MVPEQTVIIHSWGIHVTRVNLD